MLTLLAFVGGIIVGVVYNKALTSWKNKVVKGIKE